MFIEHVLSLFKNILGSYNYCVNNNVKIMDQMLFILMELLQWITWGIHLRGTFKFVFCLSVFCLIMSYNYVLNLKKKTIKKTTQVKFLV